MFAQLFKARHPVIDLVIPGLLDLPLYELDESELKKQTPALHQLLRFAERRVNSVFDIDNILLHCLGLEQSALPYSHACQRDRHEHSVLFKPVHLKLGINNAVVFPVDIEEEQLSQLISDLQDYFKEDFDLSALPGDLYLMRLHHIQPMLQVPHYLSATGKKVTHYLEQAKTNLDWFKLFNEIQMFLFQHPVNQYRQQYNLPLINSLWCWGADTWQGEFFSEQQWFSDDNEIQALGHLYCGQSYALNEIRRIDPKLKATVVDLSLLKSLKGHSAQPLRNLLMDIENNYLGDLIESANHPIQLHTASVTNLIYQPSMRRRFWKKSVQLSDFSDIRE